MTSRKVKLLVILLVLGILVACGVGGYFEGKSPFGIARTADTIEAFEKFIKEHPSDSRVAEAKKRLGQLKHAFKPKFFLIYEKNDLSSEINVFNYSITGDKTEAQTFAYVNAPDFDSSGGCRVSVRLVDKSSKRERTIVATSTAPEWRRVAVGSGRTTSSGGGSHTIDGQTHDDALNGQGLLLEKILAYAQVLDHDKK